MFFSSVTGKRALMWRLRPLIFVACMSHAAGVAQSQGIADRSVANAIEAQIDVITQPGAAQIRGQSIAWPQLIQRFYAQRDFRPAWDRPSVVKDLHRALRDSRNEGLDPKDYYTAQLEGMADEIRSGKAGTELRAQFDVLNTEALLRLGYHLSFGKVDPNSFDSQWNYGRTLEGLNVSQEIERALDADDVYSRIEALKPTHYLYVNLRRELTRYREISAAGGWKAIPEGPALKAGMVDARVAALRARLRITGDIGESTSDPKTYDSEMERAVRSYQERLGIEADGVAGARTITELNVPVGGSDRADPDQPRSRPRPAAGSAGRVRSGECGRLPGVPRPKSRGCVEVPCSGGKTLSAHADLSFPDHLPGVQPDVDRAARYHCERHSAGCAA